ncbi:MAG: class I SAM-dependent methyltransferase [Acidobacteria bacterium]|nr:MAG: class I SAM-dependent methyltransferase [Acidobacteriota bacterium]
MNPSCSTSAGGLCVLSFACTRTFDPEVRGRNQRYSSNVGPDGLPLPPDTLRVRVAGTADIESFFHGGQLGAHAVRELLAASGRPIEECRAILNFGCGCGRVLRHWKDLGATAVCSTDLNAELVQWCQAHLPFASVSVNSVEPPTSFADGRFDAIYAFSILTHMPANTQRHWLHEFHRLLRPGGLLIFSTHGSCYLPRLTNQERQQFLGGQLVARFESAAGSNLCNTYHPETFVRRELSPDWNVAAFVPEGAQGNLARMRGSSNDHEVPQSELAVPASYALTI